MAAIVRDTNGISRLLPGPVQVPLLAAVRCPGLHRALPQVAAVSPGPAQAGGGGGGQHPQPGGGGHLHHHQGPGRGHGGVNHAMGVIH